jgi:hypothetical protein
MAFTNIGYRTWIIFAATNFAIVPLIYFFFPETAFRSLEEVDVIFFLADEAPGNPWLNAVHISLHEPLWFGKKGENRIGFDYANSSWHRKLMGASSGSGSGSGSNNEKRGRKDKHSNPSSSDHRNTGSSGSDTVAPRRHEKRPSSESPIDPMMFSTRPSFRGHDRDNSSANTLTTTLASHHKNDSKRSLRQVLTRSRSSEQRLEEERASAEQQQQQHILTMNAIHSNEHRLDNDTDRIDPEADLTWWDSDLAPTPLRVSRPPSEEHRPYSSDSTTHRAFHHPDYVAASNNHARLDRPHTPESETLSFSYPGRLREDGIHRTESGNETYWPDGVEPDEVERSRAQLESSGSAASRRRARNAGRAY